MFLIIMEERNSLVSQDILDKQSKVRLSEKTWPTLNVFLIDKESISGLDLGYLLFERTVLTDLFFSFPL